MRIEHKFLGYYTHQLVFNGARGFSRGNAGAIGHAKNMRIDGNRGFSKDRVEDDIGGFASDARQRFQCLTISRNFSLIVAQDDSCQGMNISRLSVEESEMPYVFSNSFFAQIP